MKLGLRRTQNIPPDVNPRKRRRAQNTSSKLSPNQVSDKDLRRSGRFIGRKNDTSHTSLDALQPPDKSQAETLATSRSSSPASEAPRRTETDDSPAGTQTPPDSESDLLHRADEAPPKSSEPLQPPATPEPATKSSEPLQPTATPVTPEPASTINRTAWPEWLSEKYDHYAGLEFGDKWKECVVSWTELERAFEFYNPVRYIILSFL